MTSSDSEVDFPQVVEGSFARAGVGRDASNLVSDLIAR